MMAVSRHKKAQVSMEFLILMGFLTFVIIGILGVGYVYSGTINDRIRSTQISNYANKVTAASEIVFYAGEPSKTTFSANLPEGVEEIEFIDNAIVITYQTTSGENKISFSSSVPTVENSSAQLSAVSGIKNIVIIANSTHAVVSQA